MLTRNSRLKESLPWVSSKLFCAKRRFLAQVVNLKSIPTVSGALHCNEASAKAHSRKTTNPLTFLYQKTASRRIILTIPHTQRLEIAADALYKQKKIRGFCHLSTGQEAVAVGIEYGISKEDKLITAYRSHGFTFMRGGSIMSIVGELLGRQDGISHGKGGSMHMFCAGFFGGNGIVGAHVPVGAGIAFAQQYNDRDNITVDVYGDGAANQGQVHEAFNMAKLWNLPVLFGCEIMAAVKHGREFIRAGNGPLVYEYVTYRYAGHSMSDPGVGYRTRGELKAERASDPVSNFRAQLIDWGIITEDEAKTIDKNVRKKVNHEVAEAEKMPEPEPRLDVLFQDIYVRGSEPDQYRGRTVDETHY
ncbi:pyruvate dehydrogenase E1 component alpha subunit [Aspergillus fumigatus]|nr:pyruvate dehydrogenase E1 component alpha subunit [Aspergillus fumigatus]